MKTPGRKRTLLTLAALAVPFILVGETKAESVDVVCNSPGFPVSYVSAMQVAGATEGYDPGIDSSFLEYPNPAIDFYIKNSSGNYQIDARGPNSTTDYVINISGRGISGSKKVNLDFYIWNDGEGNFDWKNLIVELYNEGDISDPANKLGTYDADRLANGTQNIPELDVHEGLSYQLVVKPRNYADLDWDNKVNFKDHAVLANQWQATGQGEESTWGNYANIDRDPAGNVDMGDLSIFVNEWLWEADL